MQTIFILFHRDDAAVFIMREVFDVHVHVFQMHLDQLQYNKPRLAGPEVGILSDV